MDSLSYIYLFFFMLSKLKCFSPFYDKLKACRKNIGASVKKKKEKIGAEGTKI